MKELSDSLEAVICLAPFKHTERSNNVHRASLQGRSRMGDVAFPRVNKPCRQSLQWPLAPPSDAACQGFLDVCLQKPQRPSKLQFPITVWARPVMQLPGYAVVSAWKIQFGNTTCTTMSRTASDQSPCESSQKVAVNLSRECSGSDCGSRRAGARARSVRALPQNSAALTVVTSRRVIRGSGLLAGRTWSGRMVTNQFKSDNHYAVGLYITGRQRRKKNRTLSSWINIMIYIDVIRLVQTSTIWPSLRPKKWMPVPHFDYHWLTGWQIKEMSVSTNQTSI